MTATQAHPTTKAGLTLWRGRPGTGVLVAVAAGGLAFDLAAQHPVGVVTFGAALVAVGAVAWSLDVALGTTSRLLLISSLGPAAMLVVRDSPWVVWPNLAAFAGLLLLAAMVRDEPRPIGHAIARALRPGPLFEPAIHAIALLQVAGTNGVGSTADLGRRGRQFLRSLALGMPVVLLLVALLASADAVFASFLDIPVGPAGIGEHVSIVLAGGALTTAVLAHRALARLRPPLTIPRPLGATEVTFTLGAVLVVYAAFATSQVVAIAAGDDYVLRTTGLTYAQYARQGFFQLLAAAVVTLVILLGLVRLSKASAALLRRRLMLLAEGVVVLTLVVVAVAVRRLFLYEAEFGLTMLRLATIVAALWIGIIFVAVGLHLAGRLRRDLGLVVVGSALGVLMTFGAANPEAIVARRNIDRFGGTPRLDVRYLVDHLGADAVPTVLSDPAAAAVLCDRIGDGPDDRLLTFNLGRHRAGSAVDARCSSIG